MSTKKTPSLASTLDAQEVKYRTPKRRKKERSIHEKELAEIAWSRYWLYDEGHTWDTMKSSDKETWRSVVTVVLEEAIYRVEAKINGK